MLTNSLSEERGSGGNKTLSSEWIREMKCYFLTVSQLLSTNKLPDSHTAVYFAMCGTSWSWYCMSWCLNFDPNCTRQVDAGLFFFELLSAGHSAGQATGKNLCAPYGQSSLGACSPATGPDVWYARYPEKLGNAVHELMTKYLRSSHVLTVVHKSLLWYFHDLGLFEHNLQKLLQTARSGLKSCSSNWA